MHKILAISGGIDSMVLLDLFRNDPDVIVAHFNHGTRPSADEDELFVCDKAQEYGFICHSDRMELGEGVPEAEARYYRYQFLFGVADYYDAPIYTAHHLDDLTESIAINFARGTGWRGLCVLSNPFVVRPFLQPEIISGAPWDRKRIYKYAARHHIVYRQDPTNNEDIYLRNRIRPAVRQVASRQLYDLWQKQNEIRYDINDIIEELLPENGVCQRSWFSNLDDDVAREFLGSYLAHVGISATRPQLTDFLNAIRTYQPGKKFNLPYDNFALIGRDTIKVL